MPDIFSKRKRSAVMAAIRSRGNQTTELRLIAVFRAEGIRGWRRQLPLRVTIPGNIQHSTANAQRPRGRKAAKSGKRLNVESSMLEVGRLRRAPVAAALRVRPDFVFRTRRVAVFVDGCFWHGCPRHYRRPGSRRAFWDAKIARNRQRDREVSRALRRAEWTVLRVWEHELARGNAGRLRRRLAALAD
jgi:DNA mismatch endonuclease (patch repair protein)